MSIHARVLRTRQKIEFNQTCSVRDLVVSISQRRKALYRKTPSPIEERRLRPRGRRLGVVLEYCNELLPSHPVPL